MARNTAAGMQAVLYPIIQGWAGNQLLTVHSSGSFMKGTANKSGTDIDLFISLSEQTTETLKQIHDKLFDRMTEKGYMPTRQNVSINVRVSGYSVDLVPAKRQNRNDDVRGVAGNAEFAQRELSRLARHIAFVYKFEPREICQVAFAAS